VKLGINIGYWAPTGPPEGAAELVKEADRLGLDSVWTAEAYGSDVLTPLAWWGARTQRIRLGTAIAQLSAREPAATAMAAITMDHLSQGRFVLGLGVSGPQVVEGWYGRPFAKPLQRTREYIEIVRAILKRDGPVTYDGEQYKLPLPGSELGKPLKASVRPYREDLPIFLAAEGPKNIALSAELCDGWLALFYAPSHEDFYRDALDEGFARAGARRTREDFEIVASVPIIITDDIEGAADAMRPMYALYFGGMGARNRNFHADVARRMGYEQEVDTIQDLYLAGKKDEAAAAIPRRLHEQHTHVGTRENINHDHQP
jgi:F420-dependent oxidoreductase-like protein